MGTEQKQDPQQFQDQDQPVPPVTPGAGEAQTPESEKYRTFLPVTEFIAGAYGKTINWPPEAKEALAVETAKKLQRVIDQGGNFRAVKIRGLGDWPVVMGQRELTTIGDLPLEVGDMFRSLEPKDHLVRGYVRSVFQYSLEFLQYPNSNKIIGDPEAQAQYLRKNRKIGELSRR